MGPDISKGLNTRVLGQVCHGDGGNRVRFTKKYLAICVVSHNRINLSLHNNE